MQLMKLKQKSVQEESEEQLVLRSIKDANLPKFLEQDLPLFHGIISDIFPGTDESDRKNPLLDECVLATCKEMNLQPVEPFLEKVY